MAFPERPIQPFQLEKLDKSRSHLLAIAQRVNRQNPSVRRKLNIPFFQVSSSFYDGLKRKFGNYARNTQEVRDNTAGTLKISLGRKGTHFRRPKDAARIREADFFPPVSRQSSGLPYMEMGPIERQFYA